MGISISRSHTRKVMVGGLPIGGGSPVSVQSMTNVPTTDIEAVCSQINMLAAHGALLVRVAVPDRESAAALRSIIEKSPVPVVSDIHFDPELAIMALEAGTDKLRLNPGNIRRKADIWRISEKALELQVPIRIGVNSGSLPGDLRDKYGGVNRDSMWATAQRHLALLEETGFKNIILSLKSSDPMLTVEVNRLASAECDYPLHLGVTEAGPQLTGSVRSAVALSVLLAEGIGDTIRVSLSGSPEKEPVVGWEILSSLDIRRRFPKVISCPTCARARIDVAGIAESVQESIEGKIGNITIAVMGCEVNGPGEARDADVAIIGTPSGIQFFIDGKNTGGMPASDMQRYLDEIVDSCIRESETEAGG